MKTVLLIAGVASLAGRVATAQSPAETAARDSAQVAREAWGRALESMRASDLGAANRDVRRAASAWPTQPAYLWGRAVIAARTGDTAAVIDALSAYANLGLGRDLRAESTFVRYRDVPRFPELIARHDANRTSLSRSQVRVTFPDSTFWPEGVDYDTRTGCFYLSSIRHRTIAESCPSHPVRELWSRRMTAMAAVFAVRVDTVRNVLWATMSATPQMDGYRPADSSIAALVRVRIRDGAIERRWDLAVVPNGHALGEVVIGPRGDILVTDSNEPVLYRLRAGADSLERITSPLFRSLQGIAPAPDGRTVYVADYSHGLLRVELATARVTRLSEPPGVTELGLDGIAFDRGAIVGVQNGVTPARIMRYVLDSSGDRIVRAELLDRNLEIADEPTSGVIVGRSFVYVANSQWERYDGRGARRAGTVLRAPVLLSVPLDRIGDGR